MRIVFMGTPDIAAHCLEALYGAGHTLCGVFTRQDKPVGRKQVLTAPPVPLSTSCSTLGYSGNRARTLSPIQPTTRMVSSLGRKFRDFNT